MATTLQAALSRIKAALMRRGRTTHDADDLAQETWIRLACYDSEAAVRQPEAFLMRVALNLSIDAHRTRMGRGEEVLIDDVVLFDTAPTPEAVVPARERKARMSVCLGRLGGKTRDIFWLIELRG